MIYFEGFVLYQLATQWYIEMILMIDHGCMPSIKRFVDSQTDSSCLWVVLAVCVIKIQEHTDNSCLSVVHAFR